MAQAPSAEPARLLGGGPVRLYCTEHFSVAHARHYPWLDPMPGSGPLVADLTARAGGGSNDARGFAAEQGLGRTGTGPA